MKLAHIPGEVFTEEWRTRPFKPFGKFLLEDFDYAFSRIEAHIEGFSQDHDYLFAPLQSLYFNLDAEDHQRVGQKIIESAPHIANYHWPEFEEWYADLISRSRLRKPKPWHLAGELWMVIMRLCFWESGVRDAIQSAKTGWRRTNFVKIDYSWSEKTAVYAKENGLDGPIKYDDERLMLRHPIDPQIFLYARYITLDS